MRLRACTVTRAWHPEICSTQLGPSRGDCEAGRKLDLYRPLVQVPAASFMDVVGTDHSILRSTHERTRIYLDAGHNYLG